MSTGCSLSCDNEVSCEYSKPYCNYSLPSGKTTQLYDFSANTSHYPSGAAIFQVLPNQLGSKYSKSADDHVYLANFEIFGKPFGWSLDILELGESRSPDLQSTECALWMCVKAYNATVSSNLRQQEVVKTFDLVQSNEIILEDYIQLPTVSVEVDPNNQTDFKVSYRSVWSLQWYFLNTMEGNITLQRNSVSGNNSVPSSDLAYRAWSVSNNASNWIEGIATAMTNVIRATGSDPRDQYRGSSYEPTIVVRWRWLIFPAALDLSSLIYLVAIIHQTAASSVHSWKGSPLTLLLFELDSNIKQASYGQVDKHCGLLGSIGDTKVRMVRNTEVSGVRKLIVC